MDSLAVGSRSLWTHDRATYYALNAWTRFRRWESVPFPSERVQYGRYLIVAVEPKLPYGMSLLGPARSAHVTSRLFLAWRDGVLRGARMRWLCGGLVDVFEMTEEPRKPICRQCTYRLNDPSIAINLTLNLTQIVMS